MIIITILRDLIILNINCLYILLLPMSHTHRP